MDDFEEDPRYAVANREMWIGLGYWAAFTAVVTTTAWLIGGNVPADETTFILGFPAWFFASVLVACSIGCLIPIVLVRRVYTDLPLDADGNGAGPDEGEE